MLCLSCNKEEGIKTPLERIQENYTQMPEEQISRSSDNSIFASYTNPTERYGHGILGDKIEGGQLVIASEENTYELNLPDNYVFEDIRPRMYDVDGDGQLEFITIRSDVNKGAGIVIYKIIVDQLIEHARVLEIGSQNRWLNIVAIDDLDNDGIVEIAWIQTPHIGGILKVAKIQSGILNVISETSLYSNHAIGKTNLCLSLLRQVENQKVIYVPTQSRDAVVGFTFDGNDLHEFETIEMDVDFSLPLNVQLNLSNTIVEEEDNCIL